MHIILIYHSIGSPDLEEVGASLYTVSEANFRQQMEFISRVTSYEHRESSIENPNLCTHALMHSGTVTITFDDGLVDNYLLAFPILKELGLKAYFFVIAGKIGQPGYMNWQQLREMKDAGMIIGSHGMSHRIITELDEEGLIYELKGSKDSLEEKLGSEIQYFSVGRGFYNKRVVEKAKEAGYKTVFTSNLKDNDGFLSGRISVRSKWDLEYFKRVLEGRMPITGRIEEFIKTLGKKILGPRLYDKIRTRILSC